MELPSDIYIYIYIYIEREREREIIYICENPIDIFRSEL